LFDAVAYISHITNIYGDTTFLEIPGNRKSLQRAPVCCFETLALIASLFHDPHDPHDPALSLHRLGG
jgi:hypothetical protein